MLLCITAFRRRKKSESTATTTAENKPEANKGLIVVVAGFAVIAGVVGVILAAGTKTNASTGPQVGDIITFGAYEQDGDESNGKEAIAWRILEVDENKALVISEYALDSRSYDSTLENVTWETCQIRTWLNETFLNAAFSTEEQNKIISTNVSPDKKQGYSTDAGNATIDKVFLLGATEVHRYLPFDEDRKCVPTAYAIAQGAYEGEVCTKDGKATCYWWLRSPGYIKKNAATVFEDGSVYSFGSMNYSSDQCVRPALWLNLEV